MAELTAGESVVLFNGRKWRFEGDDFGGKIRVKLFANDEETSPSGMTTTIPRASIILPNANYLGDGPVDRNGIPIGVGDMLLYEMPKKGRGFRHFSHVAKVTKTDGTDIYGIELTRADAVEQVWDAREGETQGMKDLIGAVMFTYENIPNPEDQLEHKLRPGTEYMIFKKSVAGGRRRKTRKHTRRSRKTRRSV
jgi:hypothetical protein